MTMIQVLGTGCSRCGHLLRNAQQAIAAAGRSDTVKRIIDINRILEFNPMAFPAFVIDGKVVTVGGMLTPTQIQNLLK